MPIFFHILIKEFSFCTKRRPGASLHFWTMCLERFHYLKDVTETTKNYPMLSNDCSSTFSYSYLWFLMYFTFSWQPKIPTNLMYLGNFFWTLFRCSTRALLAWKFVLTQNMDFIVRVESTSVHVAMARIFKKAIHKTSLFTPINFLLINNTYCFNNRLFVFFLQEHNIQYILFINNEYMLFLEKLCFLIWGILMF